MMTQYQLKMNMELSLKLITMQLIALTKFYSIGKRSHSSKEIPKNKDNMSPANNPKVSFFNCTYSETFNLS